MTSHDDPERIRRGRNSVVAPRKRRRVLARIGIVVLAMFVLASCGAGLLVHQISAVRENLQQVLVLAPQLRKALEAGDKDEVQFAYESIKKQASSARVTTSGPLWKVASAVPVIGANFSAVNEVAVSAEDVAVHAVGPLIGVYNSLDWNALSPTDGRIDVTELREAEPSISAAANTVRLSNERIASIELSGLLPEISEPVAAATSHLQSISTSLDTASSAARLLPGMLGGDTPRNYLVLVQNLAESRASGGIPGALAVLHAEDGVITLGEQGSASGLGVFLPSLEVEAEQVALYTARLGTQMQNVNLTPDFPTAAATAKSMWEQRHVGQTIDGVLSLDPVVLSKLLEATGPVKITETQALDLIRGSALPTSLTSDNVVSTLLSDVYREIEDPKAQDAYFSAVAAQVFSAFTDGQGESNDLLKALSSSADENRLSLWSSHQSEQVIISSTALHGSVVGPGAGGATFGVYYNDGTGAKMDYYATRRVGLLQDCNSDGSSNYTVRVNITNKSPLDAASTLPRYVTGDGVFGVAPGRIRTNYVFYGPAQSFAETATVNGESVPVGSGKHGQRPVGTVALELGPGETAEIDMVFSKVVQDSEPRLRVSPTIDSLETVLQPINRTECS